MQKQNKRKTKTNIKPNNKQTPNTKLIKQTQHEQTQKTNEHKTIQNKNNKYTTTKHTHRK